MAGLVYTEKSPTNKTTLLALSPNQILQAGRRRSQQRCATCLTPLWTHDGGEPITVKLVNDFGKY
jgi:hypothetical protein